MAMTGAEALDAAETDQEFGDVLTGAVRGALCFNCNTALGKFGDDAANLRRAADYLEAKRDFRTEPNHEGDPPLLPGLGAS